MLERPLMRLLDVPLMSLCPEKLRSLVIFFDNARARAKAQVRASSMARHGAGWLCGHRTTKGTQLKLVMMKAVDLTPSNNPTTTTSSVAASGAADLSLRPMNFLGWQPISSDQASRLLPIPKRRKATMASSSSTPPKGNFTLDGWLAKKSLTENP
jgi:hypothetical protein